MFNKKECGYSVVVKRIEKEYNGDSFKEVIKRILETEDAKDAYKAMVECGVPRATIFHVFEDSINAVRHNSKDISPEKYISIIARNLSDLGQYGQVVEKLNSMGLIDNKTFMEYRADMIKEHRKSSEGVFGEGKAVNSFIWGSFLVSGWFFFRGLLEGTITGAVIGGGVVDFNIAFGVIFLMLGLALSHFYLK